MEIPLIMRLPGSCLRFGPIRTQNLTVKSDWLILNDLRPSFLGDRKMIHSPFYLLSFRKIKLRRGKKGSIRSDCRYPGWRSLTAKCFLSVKNGLRCCCGSSGLLSSDVDSLNLQLYCFFFEPRPLSVEHV
ncbi:hypothetical protein ILYODFUR_037519 [Ilyodon furcidens]|uniref:Uncharacterized protein n=1 Tax=Ilyodon furcidens TaxID=33524 RepID=A0ABV0U1E0_9TELE